MSKNIVLESTDKELSANGGLFLFHKLWDELGLDTRIAALLPVKQRAKCPSQICKAKSLLFSFIAGNDVLDDLDEMRQESLFSNLTEGGVSARAMGDFLRSINPMQIEMLQEILTDLSLAMRMAEHVDDNDFILAMDSAPHEQCGQKMEGVAWNYKKQWCLDSQNAYDQYGYSYGFELRTGNTYSAEGSEVMIRKIFKKVPAHMTRKFRADSAYGRKSVYNELLSANVKFAIVLRENVARVVRRLDRNLGNLNWQKTEMEFFDSHECQIGSGIYPIAGLCGRSSLRVVFIRAPKKNVQLGLFESVDDGYEYYSIVTSFAANELSNEQVLQFYRERANAENFIREQKNGFDFHHFLCQKLSANQVYGIIGTMAYNMTRFISFFISKAGCFSKRVRNKLVKLPCQVVCHARTLRLRFKRQHKEVISTVAVQMNIKFSRYRSIFKTSMVF